MNHKKLLSECFNKYHTDSSSSHLDTASWKQKFLHASIGVCDNSTMYESLSYPCTEYPSRCVTSLYPCGIISAARVFNTVKKKKTEEIAPTTVASIASYNVSTSPAALLHTLISSYTSSACFHWAKVFKIGFSYIVSFLLLVTSGTSFYSFVIVFSFNWQPLFF